MTQLRATLFLALLVSLSWSSYSLAQQELTTLTTARGYRLQIFSELLPLQINHIHSWELLLTDATGAVVSEPDIQVSGGMPDHDHGMPTLPRITRTLDNGRLLLQGVRFHMPGYWQLLFEIKTDHGSDSAEFNFTL